MRQSIDKCDRRAALDLISRYEGYKGEAYKCPGGVWTIGYGHTKGVRQGDIMGDMTAWHILMDDVEDVVKSLSSVVKVPVTDGEASALISLTFNVGIGSVSRSNLVRKLNRQDYMSAGLELLNGWDTAGGKKLQGLVNRRHDEFNRWMDGKQ